jgi:hypothetical protein
VKVTIVISSSSEIPHTLLPAPMRSPLAVELIHCCLALYEASWNHVPAVIFRIIAVDDVDAIRGFANWRIAFELCDFTHCV